MRAVIERIGPIRRNIFPDLFTALVNTIEGQQISSKALATVWGRILALIPDMTTEAVKACPIEQLQTCGISFRKAAYIKGFANTVLNGDLDLHGLQALPDDEAYERLSRFKGIGVWATEMLMTFSVAQGHAEWGDLAILRGLRMLYRHRKITPALFAKY